MSLLHPYHQMSGPKKQEDYFRLAAVLRHYIIYHSGCYNCQ